MSNGMSFEEAKNRRDNMPAWKTFEESIKSGGVTGSVARAGGSALSGIRNRVATRFSKGAKKSGQPVIRTTSNSRPPSVTRDTMTEWADSGPAVDWRGSQGGWKVPRRVKGSSSYQVTRGDSTTRAVAKVRNEARKKIAKTPKGYPGGSYHMPGGKGGEGLTAAWKRQNAPKDWQR